MRYSETSSLTQVSVAVCGQIKFIRARSPSFFPPEGPEC